MLLIQGVDLITMNISSNSNIFLMKLCVVIRQCEKSSQSHTLRKKCPYLELLSPNVGKYEPE